MVWHILKKDWKLMWKCGAAVVALQLVYALIQSRGEFGEGNESLRQLHYILANVWLFASVIWIVMLVHQDALPGTKQDWLTRPIRRIDMLVAKVVFAVLAVQGASIAGDLIQGFSRGFPIGQSLHAAIARAAVGFVWITVPALLIGVLTQSIADAMVVGVAFFLGIAGFLAVGIALAGGDQRQFDPTLGSGVRWIPDLLRYLLILVGGAILLMVQYRTRKTVRGRIIAAAATFVMCCSQTLPWKPLFALEKRLSTQPGAANQIALTWQPHIHQMGNETREDPFMYGYNVNINNPNDARLVFPLSVAGLPPDSVLTEDKAAVVLKDADGRALYAFDGRPIEVWREGAPSGPAAYDETAKIPAQVLQENKDRLVQVTATHSMTLFKLNASYSMAAVGGDRRMADFGRCKSKVDAATTIVEVDCMQIGPAPMCASVFLEDPRDGSRNRPMSACHPNYSPYIDQPIPDSVSRFPMDLPFRDTTGQLNFNVDASKIGDAQIVIRVYEPVDHFTRVVESPLVTMKDLAAR